VRVVTYNVEYALRVPQAVAALRASPDLRAPDLLLLQEMDAAGVETIARELSLGYVYFPASITPKTGRDFGNAVLSAWPIESAAKLPLPHPSRIIRQARAAVSARVCVGGRAVRVYSVHCGSPFGISDGQRRAQVKALLDDARRHPEPAIVGGDFNSVGVGRVLVADGFAWPTERVGGTRGRYAFDHVFARGFTAVGAGVVREATEASDHRPVWATLTLAPGPGVPCDAPRRDRP
jgi:endonuclease/exonuclease/phosphatase family metal-dependent hydrolase